MLVSSKQINLKNGLTLQVERYEKEISADEFYRDCVDVDYFLGLCKECPNFGKVWSCPEYDFDVDEYWKRYHCLRLIGDKILIPEEMQEKTYTPEEMADFYKEVFFPLKQDLLQEMFDLEEKVPGSVQLSAGRCILCPEGTCAKLENKPCRFPEKLRYSIESLGGNVTKAAEYLGVTIEWAGTDRLPGHFLLVGGLLYNP